MISRWYRARGYFFNSATGGWSITGLSEINDVAMAHEVLTEFGVDVTGQWGDAEYKEIAMGVADLGRVVGGAQQFKKLTGGSVRVTDRSQKMSLGGLAGCFGGHGCALPRPFMDEKTISAYGTSSVTRYWTVHELAHIIDWHSEILVETGMFSGSRVRFSNAWASKGTTSYGDCTTGCINHYERWAEAVTTYVYGSAYGKRKLESWELDVMNRLLTGGGW